MTAMLGETQNQFSLTRAASITCGRAKSNFLSAWLLLILCALPAAVQAQFNYKNTGGQFTITK